MPRQRAPRRRSRSRLASMARRLIVLTLLAAALLAGWRWIKAHPEHDPFAPLDLAQPVGMATPAKLAALRGDVGECRAVLARSKIAYETLDPEGEGPCARADRTRLEDFPLSPQPPPVTCPVAAALAGWRTNSIEPAARDIFGVGVARIEHLGAFSCRRMYGGADGPWSEHATANAIDIAAFVLDDGRRIRLIADWDGEADKARFLRRVRDGACQWFVAVLSPDYNAAHADHFHLDQGGRWSGACR